MSWLLTMKSSSVLDGIPIIMHFSRLISSTSVSPFGMPETSQWLGN
jgi:hypothetical protein